MGLFTNQALKASCGEEDTLRFFALISSLFAQMEDTPIIPGTPDQSEDIINELKQLNSKHNYLNMLSAIRVAVDHVDEQNKNRQGYYILILDYKEMRLWLRFYKPSEIDKATEDYNRIESNRKENQIDAVLVSVSSFSALRAAYPNYFSDIKAFVSAVNKIFKRSRNG